VVRSANNNGRSRARVRSIKVTVSALRDVKRAITVDGDIASDVGFQNDVNALLAVVSRLAPPTAAEPDRPSAVTDDQLVRKVVPRRARSAGRR
jgi:hypothetical protein